MAEITSTIAGGGTRQIHIRRARLTAVNGADAGKTWQCDRDLIRIGARADNDVVLNEATVSRQHAEIVRGAQGTILRDLGSTNGTFAGPVRVREVYLAPDTRFRVGNQELVFTPQDEVIDVAPSIAEQFEGMVGRSIGMREVFGVLERVAPTDLTVLVSGETGTGKELVSRALHARSPRHKGPFIVFDAGAAPESLVESELFGHERGAFTGAVGAREGLFEAAHGGTIFIDEIGELPLELQPRLLRVLEQREVRRVGSTRAKPVDVRVVAATNRDLREEVAQGRFREDLYYRLAVVEVRLPAVRERREDLPLLVDHLLHRSEHNRTARGISVRGIDPDVRALFDAYHWPGNVRELNNVVERAIPFCDGPQITMQALPASLRAAGALLPSSPPTPAGVKVEANADVPFKDAKELLIEAFERAYLVELIEKHDGNVSKAARAADMDRKSITRLLKKHGIKYRDV